MKEKINKKSIEQHFFLLLNVDVSQSVSSAHYAITSFYYCACILIIHMRYIDLVILRERIACEVSI